MYTAPPPAPPLPLSLAQPNPSRMVCPAPALRATATLGRSTRPPRVGNIRACRSAWAESHAISLSPFDAWHLHLARGKFLIFRHPAATADSISISCLCLSATQGASEESMRTASAPQLLLELLCDMMQRVADYLEEYLDRATLCLAVPPLGTRLITDQYSVTCLPSNMR